MTRLLITKYTPINIKVAASILIVDNVSLPKAIDNSVANKGCKYI